MCSLCDAKKKLQDLSSKLSAVILIYQVAQELADTETSEITKREAFQTLNEIFSILDEMPQKKAEIEAKFASLN